MCYYSVMYCENGKMKDRSIPDHKIHLEMAKLHVKQSKGIVTNITKVKETSKIYERV